MIDQALLQLGLSSFIAIIAVLNPASIIPIFLSISEDARPGVRRDMGVVISIFVGFALLFCLFAGAPILKFFGISLPAFQIAGGILLFSSGIHMIRGTSTIHERFGQPDAQHSNFTEARARFRDLIVPVGVPLFVGPGSISTVVLYSARALNADLPAAAYGVLSAACIACAIVTAAVLLSASALARILQKSGIAIMSRLIGLILCTISVQFVITGLSRIMPTIVNNGL